MNREGYTLTIFSRKTEVGSNGVTAKLRSGKLYLITNFFYTTLFFSAFTALNLCTVYIKHSRLDYLIKQNIDKLTRMSEGINVS